MKINYQEPQRYSINSNLEEYIKSIELTSNGLGICCLVVDKNNRILFASNNFCLATELAVETLCGEVVTKIVISKLARYHLFVNQIKKQHREIIANNQRRIFLEINANENLVDATVTHKTPVYDQEGNFLCLHIQFKPFTIARLANLGAKFHGVQYSTLATGLKEVPLSRIQQMIIYLYARNYSYTEVSTWITHFGHKISPSAVNKQLAKLKQLFNVTDNEGLKDMSLKLGYDIAVPAEFLPVGIHDITEDVFDLWIC
jgi:hypothetical protein